MICLRAIANAPTGLLNTYDSCGQTPESRGKPQNQKDRRNELKCQNAAAWERRGRRTGLLQQRTAFCVFPGGYSVNGRIGGTRITTRA